MSNTDRLGAQTHAPIDCEQSRWFGMILGIGFLLLVSLLLSATLAAVAR
jgi:hypothetical protein